MAVINTNITSMIGQQNLNKSQNDLSTAMERLSSGSRINSAKDDAAGQAIANRMSSQITGLNQASRNANDGISLAQTTEGALNQINDNLQRVRELTVQAQNGTNSDSDLSSIQDEISARLDEIDRVSKETDFNGTKVLNGDKDSVSIQVGSKDGQTISISLQKMDSESLVGANGFNVSGSKDVEADTSGIIGTNDSVVSYTDENGGTAYAVKTTPATGDATYAAATIDGDGVVTGGGASIDAADIKNEAAVADGDTVSGTVDKTADPLATIDAALSKVDGMRSDLGAVQNRFESAIDNLNTTSTNISAARSRIEDADYAVEVSNMTRAQILQQAGTSVLAQANQVPQGVLSLLG
ncbi:flagellin [Salinicola halophilus]|uniref:flagellin N-terminal helical domain-containing protein n=1 Tax=Salinicola halophilus TaxID=184065 RepID=UPI000DA1A674|nr:flagellin [Salinicola halophilus]